MSQESPRLDREKSRAELLAEFEEAFCDVADAVDDAPVGRIIRDSEEKVRDTMDRFRKRIYEATLQAKVDAAEASFPPSDKPDDRQADAEQGPSTVWRRHGQRPRPAATRSLVDAG